MPKHNEIGDCGVTGKNTVLLAFAVLWARAWRFKRLIIFILSDFNGINSSFFYSSFNGLCVLDRGILGRIEDNVVLNHVTTMILNNASHKLSMRGEIQIIRYPHGSSGFKN